MSTPKKLSLDREETNKKTNNYYHPKTVYVVSVALKLHKQRRTECVLKWLGIRPQC